MEFAAAVATALLQPVPPPIMRLGANSRKLFLLKRLLPTRLVDRIISKRFGLNRLRNP